MRWTSWRRRREDARRVSDDAATGPHPLGLRAIRAALEQRGVSADWSEVLAPRVLERVERVDSDRAEAILDGISIALELQHTTNAKLTESLRGLREVERMMGAFSGELSKLDEVLEVLAAYVRRMRDSGAGDQDRTLH